MVKPKIIRITTVPQSLCRLLSGQLRYINENGFEVIGISSNGPLLQEVVMNEGIRVISVEMTRRITPLKDLITIWNLYKVFRSERPLIVHSHTPKAGTMGMIAALIANVPLRLHTVAGLPLLEANGFRRKILNIVERITYKCATKIYPNSTGLNNIIIENKFTSSRKLKVIGNGSSNGIDTTYFNPDLIDEFTKQELRESLKLKPDDFVYIYIGRIVRDKGINELIESFIDINVKYSNTKLIIVGNFERELDPIFTSNEEIIHNHPSILYVGYQKDIRPYLSISNVLTFPSYREGFPNVVMQAASMQVPAIVSNINGCNEIITDGQNGWVIEVKNILLLIEKMEWCYLNQEISKSMGDRSRRLMELKYERKQVWKLIKDEYDSLINIDNV